MKCPGYVFQLAMCALMLGNAATHADIAYRGVNFSGAEAGGCTATDAKYGFKYIYPSTHFMDAYLAAGMNIFRLPFCWERLQPEAMGSLDSAELRRIEQTVNYLAERNATVILDPHNYASYWGNRLGTGTTDAMFVDLWRRLATRFANNPHVFFNLMNEPVGISGETWLQAANAAIAAIRDTGAKNLILVPGVAWSGAHSWTADFYGTPNASTLLQIRDPANNHAFEVHQYLDLDSSGTQAECVDEQVGVRRLEIFQNWLRSNRKKGFLGEFAGGVNAVCFAALANMLSHLRDNSDIWLGWTYWSTGPWQGHYMFNLLPKSNPDKPNQIDVVKRFLPCKETGGGCAPSSPEIRNIEVQ